MVSECHTTWSSWFSHVAARHSPSRAPIFFKAKETHGQKSASAEFCCCSMIFLFCMLRLPPCSFNMLFYSLQVRLLEFPAVAGFLVTKELQKWPDGPSSLFSQQKKSILKFAFAFPLPPTGKKIIETILAVSLGQLQKWSSFQSESSSVLTRCRKR